MKYRQLSKLNIQESGQSDAKLTHIAVIAVTADRKLDGPLNHRLVVEITCVIFLMKHLLPTIQEVKRNDRLDPKAPINQKGKELPLS